MLLHPDGVARVARAMEAFPADPHVLGPAVACLINLVRGGGGGPARLRGLVERGFLPLVADALPALEEYPDATKYAVLALERLSGAASAPRQLGCLVRPHVLEAIVDVARRAEGTDEGGAFAACRNLLNAMLG
jgi:hypothetical protein